MFFYSLSPNYSVGRLPGPVKDMYKFIRLNNEMSMLPSVLKKQKQQSGICILELMSLICSHPNLDY